MIARKMAPALAPAARWSPSPPRTRRSPRWRWWRWREEAGFPPGVINIVTASRERTPDVVDVWLRDARVRKITFTGSTPWQKPGARSADT
jgi:succinate-semialdehyde dehydrogenase/glutarate-semialdehyde dehydrogenase